MEKSVYNSIIPYPTTGGVKKEEIGGAALGTGG
jgi:hypothetical protein